MDVTLHSLSCCSRRHDVIEGLLAADPTLPWPDTVAAAAARVGRMDTVRWALGFLDRHQRDDFSVRTSRLHPCAAYGCDLAGLQVSPDCLYNTPAAVGDALLVPVGTHGRRHRCHHRYGRRCWNGTSCWCGPRMRV
jgi:hypothetical protein